MVWGVRNLAWVAVVGMIVGLGTGSAFGQATTKGPGGTGAASAAGPKASGTLVALVDLGQVLKSHPGVKQQVEVMKQELTDYEKEVVASRQALGKQRDRMTSFAVGSPEYKQAEEQIARQVSDLQVRDQLKKKDVLEREARIYFDAYNEITSEVSKLADQYGIGLVIRFDSQRIEPTDRNSVQAGVNRNVVFQRNLDLTKMVMQRLGATPEPESTGALPVKTATNTAAGATATKAPRK